MGLYFPGTDGGSVVRVISYELLLAFGWGPDVRARILLK